MTQRFIEFVMMQQQNAALFLGLIPNPQTGKGEVNLDVARMFIDQLVMIRFKTRSNLIEDEVKVLNSAISNLQLAFVEVSKTQGQTVDSPAAPQPAAEPEIAEKPSAAPQPEQPVADADSTDSKKKFTKSYGS